jgi:hypothetical protein
MKLFVPFLLALHCAPSFAISPFLQSRDALMRPVEFLGEKIPITPHIIEVETALVQRSRRSVAHYARYDGEESLPTPHSIAEVLSIKDGLSYFMPVTINNSTFYLMVDTGSGKSWVLLSNVTCPKTEKQTVLDQLGSARTIGDDQNCKMGPAFNGTFRPSGFHFETQYADNSSVGGALGFAEVRVAGISISEQLVRAPFCQAS